MYNLPADPGPGGTLLRRCNLDLYTISILDFAFENYIPCNPLPSSYAADYKASP